MTDLVPTVRESTDERRLEAFGRRQQLILELSQGTLTQAALAEKYGVYQSGISVFKQRHAAEIEEQKREVSERVLDYWIADKARRIETLQELAEAIAEKAKSNTDFAQVLLRTLKATAEELGQLPARTSIQINNETVQYNLVGVEISDLR